MMWTTSQEDTLREFAHLGAQGAADAIFERHGVRRSAEAVAMHASRIRVSLALRFMCPECGLMATHLNRQTGLCRRCTLELHVAEAQALNELLEEERRHVEYAPDLDDLRREYDKLRQRNSRLRRK